MRTWVSGLILLVTVLSVFSCVGTAQTIGIFGDPSGESCELTLLPGLQSLFVVADYGPGLIGVEFMAPLPPEVAGTIIILSEIVPGGAIGVGDTQSGVTIGFQTCQTGKVVVLELQIFVTTPLTLSCLDYPVIAHPVTGVTAIHDCDFMLVEAFGIVSKIQPDGSCPCNPVPCLHHGDVNFSSSLTAEDAQMVFEIVLGYFTPTFEEECAADCDGGDSITAEDAQTIFLNVLGLGAGCQDPLSGYATI